MAVPTRATRSLARGLLAEGGGALKCRRRLGPASRSILAGSLVLALSAACATSESGGRRSERSDVASQGPTAEESAVVECLLPAQVRKLGSQFVYLAPRRMITTSARECEMRGGTFTAAAIGSASPSAR